MGAGGEAGRCRTGFEDLTCADGTQAGRGHVPAAADASEQRPGGNAGGVQVRPHAVSGAAAEIQDGAGAVRVGLAVADRQAGGAIGFGGEVSNLERGGLGDPEQRIGHDRDQGGIAQIADRAALGGDLGNGIGIAEAQARGLAAAACAAVPAGAPERALRQRPNGGVFALEAVERAYGRGDEGQGGGGEPGLVTGGNVVGQQGIGEGAALEPVLEGCEGGGVGAGGIGAEGAGHEVLGLRAGGEGGGGHVATVNCNCRYLK